MPLERNSVSLDQKSSFKFFQEISCSSATNSTQGSDADMGIPRGDPDQSLEAFVTEISIGYLMAHSEGAFEKAYAALSDYIRVSSLSDWSQRTKEANDAAGKLRSARVWRVTVYDNPPGAPRPGRYIAADFETEYERIPLQCGYLVWRTFPVETGVRVRSLVDRWSRPITGWSGR